PKSPEADGRLDWVVWVEGGKHGSHLILKNQLQNPDQVVWGASGFSDRDHFLKYNGRANDHSPQQQVYQKQRLSEGKWDGIPATRAHILPLWPWFAQMYQGEGSKLVQNSPTYRNLLLPADIRLRFERDVQRGIYRSMAGAEGNKATFPWGQDLERFFDPAEAFSHRFKRRVDCSYVYNPYLQSLLARKLVTPDGSGGPAFPPEWNARVQGACAP
ncbi:MAG: hypothetical protein JNL98_31900, partial [Bryobacterales bacterium]|nr:hypothetical protein [Bryobacterales bacterium]